MSKESKAWLVNFADWAMKAAILATLGLLVQITQTQNEILQKMSVQNMRITQLEKDYAYLKGNMVSMETLKRVELYMELIMTKAGIKQKIDLSSKQTGE